MKHTINKIIVVFLVLVSVCFVSCEKQDNEKDWGYAKIYMPQAISTYNVTYAKTSNFTIDSVNNKINIHLGIIRSATQEAKAFTVELSTNNDTINSLINNKILTNTQLLPAECYSLPTTITVPDGKTETTFYLAVDKGKLITFAGKNVAVAVRISNPSLYELNTALSTTIINISANSFLNK